MCVTCEHFIKRTRAVTRGQVNSGLALPPVFTRYGLTSISFLVVERWNTLPAECRQAPSLPEFVSRAKTFLGFPRPACWDRPSKIKHTSTTSAIDNGWDQ